MDKDNPALQVGKKLVELCKQGKNLQAVDTLYAPNIVSLELHDMPNMPARMEGIDAIRKKNQWWFDNHTVHSTDCKGPWPHGERFIVLHKIDVTAKAGPMAGKRMQAEEAGLYTVKNGKIVQEEFFYDMGG
jgi:ketosteroid isomerase-like protein